MSSDNGIYILKTGDEYRVEECSDSGLDNIHDPKLGEVYLVAFFGKSKVFNNIDQALKEAYVLSKKYYTEYGICNIELKQKFPTMTYEEAIKKLN